jgi:hypothetical protein
MKKIIVLIIIYLFVSCSSTQLVESWKNPNIDTYEPYKVLIVGLTSDEAARIQFEEKLITELKLRGTEGVSSLTVLDNSVKTDRMTETELEALESKLIEDGFDAIILTKIIGIEDKGTYRKNYKNYDDTYRRFKDEYLMYQDVSYNSDYYEEYKIYKAETSMYCICPTKDRELIWKGYINITDPTSIKKTVNDYVKLMLIALEEEKLLNAKIITNK